MTIHQPSGPTAPTRPAPTVPALPEPAPLPSVPPGFTGREDQVQGLLDLLGPRQAPGAETGSYADDDEVPAVVVTAVAGMGGIGKTTLALAAGHAALRCGLFTGALFLDLLGYDDSPVEAGQALDGALRALGVAVEQIPSEDHARAALYRAQLQLRSRHGQRILVIADNASRLGQVEHLLPPGDGPHRLLVTSRDDLPGLGARLVDLDVLEPAPAARLIRTAVAIALPRDTRVADDPAGTARVAQLCGFLPLALQIAAAQLVAERHLKPAQLADDLHDIDGRLDVLDDGSRTVRAVLDRSYRRLAPTHAELFRTLALNPGPDVSTESVVGFTGAAKPKDVRARLTTLVRASLIRQDADTGRWRMHDLVRAYAAEQAHAHPVAEAQALRRILVYYDRAAWEAETHLNRDPGRRPAVRNRARALTWLDAERDNLIAAVHSAYVAGHLDIAHRLPATLGEYLLLRRHLEDLWGIAVVSREAAHATDDRRSQARALTNLGTVLQELGKLSEAVDAQRTALSVFLDLDNQHSAARSWGNLGNALQKLGMLHEAVAAHRAALAIFLDLEHQHGVAWAWTGLGNDLQKLDRFQEAADAHQTALTIYQSQDDDDSTALGWNNLGVALRSLGVLGEATAAGRQAVAMLREQGDVYREGEALDELADTLRAAGLPAAEVRAVREESADAYRRAGAAEKADEVVAKPDAS
ncbi:tetratricopeptide repeat protein [Kitasatospora mediocidica]|uniref:tetratricopeptide repeat protein n=1 Tax=Kitasatospora mediocidica TaxID=58352 RepID=UPI0012F99544|nr:tetratricopeptide repeat protein [Kitasatospora mediocidica]